MHVPTGLPCHGDGTCTAFRAAVRAERDLDRDLAPRADRFAVLVLGLAAVSFDLTRRAFEDALGPVLVVLIGAAVGGLGRRRAHRLRAGGGRRARPGLVLRGRVLPFRRVVVGRRWRIRRILRVFLLAPARNCGNCHAEANQVENASHIPSIGLGLRKRPLEIRVLCSPSQTEGARGAVRCRADVWISVVEERTQERACSLFVVREPLPGELRQLRVGCIGRRGEEAEPRDAPAAVAFHQAPSPSRRRR